MYKVNSFDEYCDINVNSDLDSYEHFDYANKQLTCIPILDNKYFIQTLHLQENAITEIPEDFFPSLPNLTWLDLRDNLIQEIPKSVEKHPSLTELLLQNNKLTALPAELGTVENLKTLQLTGNPLYFPERNIWKGGVRCILNFLKAEYRRKYCIVISNGIACKDSDNEDGTPTSTKSSLIVNIINDDSISQNKPKFHTIKRQRSKNIFLKVNFQGKPEVKKCLKLEKSRETITTYSNSSKYVQPPNLGSKLEQILKILDGVKKEAAQARQIELIERREKILQSRRDRELLREWRTNYKRKQQTLQPTGSKSLDPQTVPYDIDSECLKLPSRADLEKDLPDKYRKKLRPRSRMTVPRRKSSAKSNLMSRIKQLFNKLEEINMNRDNLTPRTEQQMLMTEIGKVNEIKQQLEELSLSNVKFSTST